MSIQVAIQEFHTSKAAIYTSGGQQGKYGPIDHWNIPKLKLMNSVHQSIIWMGTPY